MKCEEHPNFSGKQKPRVRCGRCYDIYINFLRNRFYEEADECIHILRELKRTEDTSGCYNPFNKSFPRIASVVHTLRKVLKQRVENQNTGHEIIVELK